MVRARVVAKQRLVWLIAFTLVAVTTPREGLARTEVVTTRLDYATAAGCPTGTGTCSLPQLAMSRHTSAASGRSERDVGSVTARPARAVASRCQGKIFS